MGQVCSTCCGLLPSTDNLSEAELWTSSQHHVNIAPLGVAAILRAEWALFSTCALLVGSWVY